jgi:ribonuclease VapC
MSTASLLETAIVVETRYRDSGAKLLDELIETMQIQIFPVTVEQVTIARTAYRQYGKGNHEARLNFGDCFTYALAKTTNEPLLFKGNDFNLTDLLAVALE